MKKIIAILLAGIMLISFAACGAKKSDSDLAYIKDKGVLTVGITDYAPMDYKDKNGAIVEKSTDSQKLFAVGGQMTLAGGKETGKRVWFYRCKATRPSVAGKTKEKSPEVQSNSLTVKVMPRLDNDDVKATCVSTDACYNTFFDKVYEPTYDAAASTGTGA